MADVVIAGNEGWITVVFILVIIFLILGIIYYVRRM